jgi:hypothetical protein
MQLTRGAGKRVCVCLHTHVYTRAGVDAGTGIVSIEQYATAVDAAIELPSAGTSIQSKRGRSRAFIFSAGVAVFPLKKSGDVRHSILVSPAHVFMIPLHNTKYYIIRKIL